MMEDLRVSANYQGMKIRCEIIDQCIDNTTNRNFILIASPFEDGAKTVLSIIPLLYMINKPWQRATLITNDRDKAFIENRYKRDNYEILYQPNYDLTFDIYHTTEHKASPFDEMVELITSEDPYSDFILSHDMPKVNPNEVLVDILFHYDINDNILRKINYLFSSSSDDALAYQSIKEIVLLFRKSQISTQDVIRAFNNYLQCVKRDESIYSALEMIKVTKLHFTDEENREIHHRVVLSNPSFFSDSDIYNSADYFYYRKDYQEAAILFNEHAKRPVVQKRKHTLASTYNSIACSYLGLLQFDKACQYYKKAIRNNPKNPAYPNNLAYALATQSEITQNHYKRHRLLRRALESINEAISIDDSDRGYYTNKVYIEYELGELQNAILSYQKTRECSLKYDDYKTALQLYIDAKIKLSINEGRTPKISDLFKEFSEIEENEDDTNKYYYMAFYIYKMVKHSENEERLKLLSSTFLLLEYYVKELLDSLSIHDPLQSVFYYTSLHNLQLTLSDEDETTKHRLPLFHFNHMNDPREGQELTATLLSLFGKSELSTDLLEPNKESLSSRKRLLNDYVFLKSFTKNDDSLPMWIHYGDAGKGCCVKVARDFFSNFTSDLTDDEGTLDTYPDKTEYRLHSVLYVKNGKPVKSVSRKTSSSFNGMITSFSSLNNIYSDLQPETKALVINCIQKITNRLRYLIKSSDYEYEGEMRIVVSRNISRLSKPDNGIKMTKPDDRNPIPKVYMYTCKSIPIEEVILGPKVNECDNLIPYLETKLLETNSYNLDTVQITKSEIEYR